MVMIQDANDLEFKQVRDLEIGLAFVKPFILKFVLQIILDFITSRFMPQPAGKECPPALHILNEFLFQKFI